MEDAITFDRMLRWETVVSGLFYGLIVLHYYKNVLIIKTMEDPRSMSINVSKKGKNQSTLNQDSMSFESKLDARLLDEESQN